MRWLRFTFGIREAVLTVALMVAVVSSLVVDGHASIGRVLAGLLLTGPLIARLRFPLSSLTLVIGGALVGAALTAHQATAPVFVVVAVLLALYAVGSRTSGVQLAAGAAVSLTGLLGAGLLATNDPGGVAAVAIIVTASGLIVGGALRTLRFESDRFAERESELERERDALARAAVAHERRRIARELHDVIGHSISVMGVQAGAVRSVLRADQQREREALHAVERTGRQAVGEMRRLIGLLRTEGESLDDPTPSLSRVEELVTGLRRVGLTIALRVEGDLSNLSPGVDLAGYRIVQEALTNVLKHAPDAVVDVSVCCSSDALTISVVDNGDVAAGDGDGMGHGLIGMRERAILYGGELSAGRGPGGGFTVRAQIPMDTT